MIRVLVDHNMEGQALLLWGALAAEGWLALLPVPLRSFGDVGLSFDTSDREVWRFAQEREMVLLTANRSLKGVDSLERTLREEVGSESLPVLTVGQPERMEEREYRQACAVRLMEIFLDLDTYRGVGRLYLP